MSTSSRGKQGRKMKEKFLENSGMNLSGNSAATQINLAEEQPVPAPDIKWQLQVKAQTYYLNSIDSDQEDWVPSINGPSSYTMQPALTSMPEVSHSYPYVQQGQCGGSTLGPYTYLPPELDYALPTLAARFVHSVAPHLTQYSVPLQHTKLAQRWLWPGEMTPNEAQEVHEITINARTGLKGILLSQNLLPDAAIPYD
ncbi:hypothetical protein BKA82DRAFT_4353882 [Pisolithus tinctorius]|nr:hypothetical protein BKA82DRAFT_4353882 [Pisolithus tinctorius]